MTGIKPRAFLARLFQEAVAAADPARVVPEYLPSRSGRTLVLAAGKAAASMANAVEGSWTGPVEGMAVTRYGHGLPLRHIELIEAGHPLPDSSGRMAASRFLSAAGSLRDGDLLLFLLSGGASALLVEPAEGLGLAEKHAINRALLKAGAPISDMNCLRKHLSAIKGGRLAAAAAPARVVTLAISDVPGDDPGVIGSGPTAPDPTTCADALEVASRYGLDLPPGALTALARGDWETVKPGDPCFSGADYKIIARPDQSLGAAAEFARTAGLRVNNLGSELEGEAAEIAREHALMAKQWPRGVVISGGELTVTHTGTRGRGGPNCEYLLALALALEGASNIYAIACDTDGIDGSGDAAGAVIDPDTLNRSRALGMDPSRMLEQHDSYGFFERLGDLVQTGPTRTNVNDFRAILLT